MRRSVLLLLFVAVVTSGCGSPEKYQKQGFEADTSTVDVALGFDVGEGYRSWARQFILTMGQSRISYEAGDTLRALLLTDSLINSAESSLDTIPLTDVRSKFLLVMLTDLHSQGITWQELRGDTINVQVRTAKFQRLAERVRRTRDSLDRLGQ